MNRIALHFCSAAICWLLTLLSFSHVGILAVQGDELAEAQIEQARNDILAGLEHAHEFIKNGQWNDGVETLTRIMENHGDALIEVPVSPAAKSSGFSKFVPLREYCQRVLASWSVVAPEALAAYRRRVDSLAQQWYEEAIETGSESQLQRIVDELLLSSSGDQALLRLGERALERGNYVLARGAWERLSPQLRVPDVVADALGCSPGCSWWVALRGRELDRLWPRIADGLEQKPSETHWLAYPDTDVPLAAVRSRLILVSLLQGEGERVALEFELLRRLHPDDRGELAGRVGEYVDLVADVIREAGAWQAAARPEGWTTFGGCMARNQVVDRAIDVAQRPVWQTALPRLEDRHDILAPGRQRIGERYDGLLSYHVAVSNGVAFVLQPGMIRAIEVATGEPAWPFLPSARTPQQVSYGAIYSPSPTPREDIPRRSDHAGVPRYCVTLKGHCLFARMGPAWTGGDTSLVPATQRSSLVGIDLRTQKLILNIPPGEPGWEFESSPVATDTHLFATVRSRDPASAQVRVNCYSIKTGRLVWQRNVVRGEAVGETLFEIPNNVLTLSDDTLYHNTNLGAVAALRVDDGRLKWIYRYQRAGLRGNDMGGDSAHWARDLTPCLVHHNLVIAAPADCQRILALDAEFGRLVWATVPGVAADAVHLAGVGENHLLASGDCLYWFDVYSGRLTSLFPSVRGVVDDRARPSPRGYGRAVLAGNEVLWPTYEHIYFFRQHGNQQVRQPLHLARLGLTGGNLVVYQNTLLIAGADRLTALNPWGYVVESRAASRDEDW